MVYTVKMKEILIHATAQINLRHEAKCNKPVAKGPICLIPLNMSYLVKVTGTESIRWLPEAGKRTEYALVGI